MNTLFRTLITALVLLCGVRQNVAFAGPQIPMGHWVGSMSLDGATHSFAVSMDSYVYQPDNLDEFPKLQMLFKAELGGYGASEYTAQIFRDVNYDFHAGILTLDEPTSDLLLNGAVTQPDDDQFVVDATVLLRSTAQTGKMHLQYQSNEPGGGGVPIPPMPLAPTLAGEYTGRCGMSRAVLQLETGRGLSDGAQSGAGASLSGYAIHGRLGVEDRQLCNGTQRPGEIAWCSMRNFISGTFNFALGSLTLETSNSTESCQVDGVDITCRIAITDRPENCTFHRNVAPIRAYGAFPRQVHVPVSTAQSAALPDPNPPESSALLSALNGQYHGYLHHESTDQYQPVTVVVQATTSTNNPHNENLVYVSVVAKLGFGDGTSPESFVQPFDRRSFYLTRGFVLHGDTTDAFVTIGNWTVGALDGVWFSQQFGRVGTIEVVKSPSVPPLPAGTRMVPKFGGNYRGPTDSDATFYNQWALGSIVSPLPIGHGRTTQPFSGRAELYLGNTRFSREDVTDGAYDFYAGRVAFETVEGSDPARMTTGKMGDDGDLRLFWPGAVKFGVGIMPAGEFRYSRESF